MTWFNVEEIEPREIIEGYRARFIHSDNMTLAYWEVDAGAALPTHQHVHEQVANMLEGRFELTVDGETREVGPGEVAVIPSHVPHGGRALTDCRILDVFHPAREDYQ